MPRKPQLQEPVIVERLWANRQHDAVYVTLSTFRDQNLVDIRKHSMNASGRLVPTTKGIALKKRVSSTPVVAGGLVLAFSDNGVLSAYSAPLPAPGAAAGVPSARLIRRAPPRADRQQAAGR